MKRGQLGIFLILGIFLFAILMIFLFANKDILNKPESKPVSLNYNEQIKFFVEQCLKESSANGIRFIFSQGGYNSFPQSLDVLTLEDGTKIPYYFSGGNNHEENSYIPELSNIEEEIARSTETYFFDCIGDFNAFIPLGVHIQSGSGKIKVKFSEKSILFDLDFPLQISFGEQTGSLNKFVSQVNVDFLGVYNSLKNYLVLQSQQPDYFLVGELSELAYKNKIKLQFKQFGNQGEKIVVSFILQEKFVSEKDEPLAFNFALDYDWVGLSGEAGLEETEDYKLKLKNIPPWEITSPGLFTKAITAQGAGLTYELDSDNLNLFNINQNGIISLNTNHFENGEYAYFVKVKDDFGNEINSVLPINIKINKAGYPVIEKIEDQTAFVGQPFSYTIKAHDNSGENLKYSDNTNLFEIDEKTGLIEFTPAKEMKGKHSISIYIQNAIGRQWEKFNIEIK